MGYCQLVLTATGIWNIAQKSMWKVRTSVNTTEHTKKEVYLFLERLTARMIRKIRSGTSIRINVTSGSTMKPANEATKTSASIEVRMMPIVLNVLSRMVFLPQSELY